MSKIARLHSNTIFSSFFASTFAKKYHFPIERDRTQSISQRFQKKPKLSMTATEDAAKQLSQIRRASDAVNYFGNDNQTHFIYRTIDNLTTNTNKSTPPRVNAAGRQRAGLLTSLININETSRHRRSRLISARPRHLRPPNSSRHHATRY